MRTRSLVWLGLSLVALGLLAWLLWPAPAPKTATALELLPLGQVGDKDQYWLSFDMTLDTTLSGAQSIDTIHLEGLYSEEILAQDSQSSHRTLKIEPYALSWESDGKPHPEQAEFIRFLSLPHAYRWQALAKDLVFEYGGYGKDPWRSLVHDLAQYVWLAVPDAETATWVSREADAMGAYDALYTAQGPRAQRQIERQFSKYYPRAAGFSVTTSPDSQSRWLVAADTGRVLRQQTLLTATIAGPNFKSVALIKLSLERDKAAPTSAVALSSLLPTPTSTPAMASEDEKSTSELLVGINTVTEETKSTDYYQLFTTLKARWQKHPEEISTLLGHIKGLSGKDPAEKRQISLFYGALAQTDRPEAAAALVELMGSVTDQEALVQAAAALGDHPNPGPRALDVLWQHVQEPTDAITHNTALLAYGSVANHLGGAQPEVVQKLLALGQKATASTNDREVAMAAMGNHGDSVYAPFLKTMSTNPDSMARAQAMYSMRFLPAAESVDWITNTALKDPSNDVKGEAVKALIFQLGQADTLSQITTVALASNDREIQLRALRAMQDQQSKRPESAAAALAKLAAETKVEAVRKISQQAKE